MRLNKLKLVGYKYLKFNHINSITVDYDSLIQIILGKNGSGKSKLIKQMSPLPGLPSDFDSNGLKEVELTDNGKVYLLSSDFSKKKPHSFIVDDVELNPGGTISVQRDLVKRELNYTEDLHQLLLDKTPFTEMSPSKRREFLQNISDCDVSFATEVYKKVMSHLRDTQGTIKVLKEKLSKELDTLKTMDVDMSSIESMINDLQDEISDLMRVYYGNSSNETNLNLTVKMDAITSKAMSLINNITSLRQMLDEQYGYLDGVNISKDHESIAGDIVSKQHELTALYKQHDKVYKLVMDMDSGDVGNIDDLKVKLKDDIAELNKLTTTLGNGLFKINTEANIYGISRIPDIKLGLIDVLSELPDNSDKRFSKATLDAVNLKIAETNAMIAKYSNMYEATLEKIEHINNSDKSECPKCNYKWIPGITPRELNELKERVIKIDAKVKELKEELVKLNDERDSLLDYLRIWSNLNQISRNYPESESLFTYLMTDGRIHHAPSQHIPLVHRWCTEMELTNEIQLVKIKIDNKRKLIESTGDLNTPGINGYIDSISEEIDSLNRTLSDLDARLKPIENIIDLYSTIERDVDEFNRLSNELKNLLGINIRKIRNDVIDENVKENQLKLTELRNRQNLARGYQHRIDAISDSIKSTEDRMLVLKDIVKILSPVDGLIAKSMGNFINRFVEQLNVVIGSIYTYPLEIHPCDVSEDGLTYKFPMTVNNMKDSPDDISEGSDGQKEVINFAFKVVSTMFMGCDTYPLMLDEIGRAQDEVHMSNIMSYIKTLASSNSRQIFMISHYASAHSSYTNADFIVLNNSNITAPSNSNSNCIIEY